MQKIARKLLKLWNVKRELKSISLAGMKRLLLVNENHIAENMDREHGYLYVNVGGGSTDLIFFVDGKLRYKKSIDIGTIRILKEFSQRIRLG